MKLIWTQNEISKTLTHASNNYNNKNPWNLNLTDKSNGQKTKKKKDEST